MWLPTISKTSGPRYLAVANAISEAIDSGELPPGTRLPPQRDLAQGLGVTVGTIGRAYLLMKKRRLVTCEVGRGTFVRGDRQSPQVNGFAQELARSEQVDFGCFRVPVHGVTEQMAAAIVRVGQGGGFQAHHVYPPGNGYLSHRSDAANWLSRVGLSVDPERLVLCNGAQAAISVALVGLTTAGDTVLTECLTYSGLKSLSHLLGVKLTGLDIDDEGLIPEALEAACAATGARLLYLQPTVHNPTAAVMPLERRRQIVELARKYDLTIFEDDAAASAMTDRPPPIAALAPERTIYVSSFGKSISPALRIGYMVVPPALVEQLEGTQRAMNLAVPPVVAEIASTLMAKGTAEEIAQQYLAETAKRQAAAAAILSGHEFRAHPAAFFLWLALPPQWRSDEFVAAAQREGVNVVGAENFIVGRSRPADAVRISVNGVASLETMRRGLQTLARLLESQPKFAIV